MPEDGKRSGKPLGRSPFKYRSTGYERFDDVVWISSRTQCECRTMRGNSSGDRAVPGDLRRHSWIGVGRLQLLPGAETEGRVGLRGLSLPFPCGVVDEPAVPGRRSREVPRSSNG